MLRNEELSIAGLAERMPVSRTAVVKHLQILTEGLAACTAHPPPVIHCRRSELDRFPHPRLWNHHSGLFWPKLVWQCGQTYSSTVPPAVAASSSALMASAGRCGPAFAS